MSPLPWAILAFFLLTALLTLLAFYNAVRGSKTAIGLSIVWIYIQSAAALFGFFLVTDAMPPRLLAALAHPILANILAND